MKLRGLFWCKFWSGRRRRSGSGSFHQNRRSKIFICREQRPTHHSKEKKRKRARESEKETRPDQSSAERTQMFGRVRVSTSSSDELERPTAKLLKHDSLSIYESTLLKLRTGSKLAKGAPFEGMHTGEEMDMVMEADSNSTSTVCTEAVILPCGSMTYDDDDDDDDGGDSSSNTLHRSIDSDDGSGALSSKHRSSHSKTKSIHQMFSRYKDSKAAATSHDQMMAAENNYSPIMPPNSGRYSCPLDMDQQLEPDCISSITVGSV